jgi:hypothetical protein
MRKDEEAALCAFLRARGYDPTAIYAVHISASKMEALVFSYERENGTPIVNETRDGFKEAEPYIIPLDRLPEIKEEPMKLVHIPFLFRFRDPLLSEPQLKDYTCRTRKMGSVGDVFDAFGARFRIEAVSALKLGDVLKYFDGAGWSHEGVRDRDDFESIWKQLHPSTGLDPARVVFLHHFRRVVVK